MDFSFVNFLERGVSSRAILKLAERLRCAKQVTRYCKLHVGDWR
jgi:hypothetical protein